MTTFSEAFEAILRRMVVEQMNQRWPHCVVEQKIKSANDFDELMRWMGLNIREPYELMWANRAPVLGMDDPDDAFATKMRWG